MAEYLRRRIAAYKTYRHRRTGRTLTSTDGLKDMPNRHEWVEVR